MLSAVALIAVGASGQDYTAVTAVKLTDLSGNTIASGKLCFTGTDDHDKAIAFRVGSGGQAVQGPSCTPVTNGAIGAFQVANPGTTNPQGILYRVELIRGAQTVRLYTGVAFSGATFDFDQYVPTGITLPPVVNGQTIVPLCDGCSAWTAVTGLKLTDVAGVGVNGKLCWTATDTNDKPIAFQVGGGGQVVTSSACVDVTAGQLAAAFQVPNPQATVPAGVVYRITMRFADNAERVLYRQVAFSGATFSFDNYGQTASAVLPPNGGTINGDLQVNGSIHVTGSIAAGSNSAARHNPLAACDGVTTTFDFGVTIPSEYQLFWNGMIQTPVDDYTVSGSTVTLLRPCKSGDHLFAYF